MPGLPADVFFKNGTSGFGQQNLEKKSAEKLRLFPDTPFCRKTVAPWKKSGKPSFSAENVYHIEKDENSPSVQKISQILRSISRLKGIEYYSNSRKRWRTFSTHIYALSSAFMGLSLAAFFCILHEEKSVLKNNLRYCVFGLVGAFLIVALTMLKNFFPGNSVVDFSALNFWQYLFIFASGVAAVTAMILPGISDSTVLLICGIYVPAVSAFKEVMAGNFEFAGGCVCLVLGLVAGLVLGSLYAIIYGPSSLKVPLAPLSLSTFSVPAFLAGIAALAGMEFAKRKMEKVG